MNTIGNRIIFFALILLIFTFINEAKGQNFTKITTGAIATVAGDSWGCSWEDYNRDGYLDLFVANTVNDFLFLGTGDSIFSGVTTGSVVFDSLDSRGSCWGDYDNDGDEDLFVSAGNGNNLLYRNDGNGILTKTTAGIIVNDGGTSRGCAWGDYDNDGWLDLFVANVGNNFLYHNDGGGNFTKIDTGGIVNTGGQTIGCCWVDYNNDGFLDLHAVNFNGSALLFKNNGNGSFTQITTGAIVTDVAASTGAGWGDYDDDGDLDLVVANAGDQGNFFYKNTGAPDYTFVKDTASIIAHVPGDSYATCWVDYDNDGDLDLFISNRANENEFLFNNSGFPSYTFTRITTGALVNDSGSSYGSAWGDYDNDGDLDVFICNKSGDKNSLFENNGNSNDWVNIKCIGATANKSGIGARVSVKANINGNPVWQMHEITDQSAYYSQNSLDVEFGFGSSAVIEVIDSLVIKWPGGQMDVHTNLAVNRFYTAVQGQGIVGINNLNENLLSGYKLGQNYPNPFNPNTIINYSIPAVRGEKSFVVLKVYDILGKEVAALVNEREEAGNYSISFEGGNLMSGVYFYQMIVNGVKIETKSMLLLK
jgi:ASPIC and UnbV/FG-GAP-like repeat/Secretion system C-terminal sorting domain